MRATAAGLSANNREITSILSLDSGRTQPRICNLEFYGGREMRIILTAFAVALSLAAAPAAEAQSFSFENSTVTPSGQQISVLRLPVRKPNGRFEYKDVLMQFEFVGGQLRFAPGYPVVSDAPARYDGAFVAGSYLDEEEGVTWTLSGPLTGPDGRSRWSLVNGTTFSTDFYTGAVSGHPLQARIDAAGVNANYTFGFAAFQSGRSYQSLRNEDLLALVQVDANTLQILDFTTTQGDRNVPTGVVTFKRRRK